MRCHSWIAVLVAVVISPIAAHTQNPTGQVKKAIERSTLAQPGTKPFHLKAVLAPSLDRDKDSGRTGNVEIWWASPTLWKREVRSLTFHRVEIVDGARNWQKNEGDYFPVWLSEIAVALIDPVPPREQVLDQVKAAEVRRMMGQINIDWTADTGTAEVRNILRSSIALRESTGLLIYASGFGWGGLFHDYESFHGRMIARTVSAGSPEVTAKVTMLEDLGDLAPGFFEAPAAGGDPQPLQTVLLDETSLRRNLLPMDPPAWPPLQNGLLEGNVTTTVVVDREGKVREITSIVSENSTINEAGRQRILAMRFQPFLRDGVPVQAMSQITLPFKTVRPPGVETFESARTYFERARKMSFLAAGTDKPYLLRAEFQAKTSEGIVDKGRYEDTRFSDTQWRREASIGTSRYVRSRSGEKRYELAEGPDVGLLRFLFRTIEPIPAIDTFVESDWRIKRDMVGGVRTVRVLAGYENPDGQLDPEQARGYWFDGSGLLLKTYFSGVETQWSDFEEFSGLKIARQVDLHKDGKLAVRVHITEVTPAAAGPANYFEIKGHEWQRAFTAEER